MQRHERHHVCDHCGQTSNESSFLRKHLRNGICPNVGGGSAVNNTGVPSQFSNLMKLESQENSRQGNGIGDTNLLLSMTKNNTLQNISSNTSNAINTSTANFLTNFTQNLSLAKSSSHPPAVPNLPSLANLTSGNVTDTQNNLPTFNINNLLPSPVTTFSGTGPVSTKNKTNKFDVQQTE